MNLKPFSSLYQSGTAANWPVKPQFSAEQRASRSRLLIWNPVTIFYHLKHDLYWVKVQFCS